MGRHTVEIGDVAGNSFKISVNIGYTGVHTEGSWRSLDKGWIRYNSGIAKKYQVDGTISEADLRLFGTDGFDGGYGIVLYKWDDIGGTNDQGTGMLYQPWVLNAKPGKISWALVE
jgi:hypothetical protein